MIKVLDLLLLILFLFGDLSKVGEYIHGIDFTENIIKLEKLILNANELVTLLIHADVTAWIHAGVNTMLFHGYIHVVQS